ncbi:MAG: transcription-repair coupling factor [Alphaproteobacteria bacterium]|nr:transcription-repair coupling factor [Alphaproteobacteria bacterium]
MMKLCGVPTGYEVFVLERLLKKNSSLLYLVRDEARLSFLHDILSLVMPHVKVLSFPAWDTVPYDRVSMSADIEGIRIETLSWLASYDKKTPVIVLVTTSAVMQRVPEIQFFKDSSLSLKEGDTIAFDVLKTFLSKNGYKNTSSVLETGEYAIRGGLIDLWPAGFSSPVRIDFFGDEVDTIRSFDAITQRSGSKLETLSLKPMREFSYNEHAISLFRSKYRDMFGVGREDTLYEAVSNGRYIQGVEHFLPLFHERMVSFFDYVQDFTVISDFGLNDALQARHEQIMEYYNARCEALKDGMSNVKYYPISPELFFWTPDEIIESLSTFNHFSLSPFTEPNSDDMKGRSGKDYVDLRVQSNIDVMEQVSRDIRETSKRVLITAATGGSVERIIGLLREKQTPIPFVETWTETLKKKISAIVAPFEKGFQDDNVWVLTETDIFGERIIRTPKRKKNANYITDITALNVGDLVVHTTHGIGRFDGLITLQIGGAAHDCLRVLYDGGDKLFVPVENLDVLSRYGNEGGSLDKLGSVAFVNRKERVKKDLFAMAGQLIEIASKRELNQMPKILAPHGMYQEFCARFPYTETDDQLHTIADIEGDFAKGRPMDRLVCGDVGFGKTEVAMRAAFLAAMNGEQVAMIAPTTLLARQHAQNFAERFKNFPIRIGALSRLVSSHDAKLLKDELEKGTLDIVVGTHSLLSQNIKFKRLGLVIIDEEQHFGVKHKERLKQLKEGVHVLTLTATPIPRTLQLSLAGVRELSIIATPPVDRLAVKTFVTPFDGVIIKEAILREHFRGGQTFFVCPRISDMNEVEDVLKKLVPDIKVVKAHGQMAATQLEKIMTDFADKKYDVLLATSIIESGLDMPSVNTMIVYRSDMFGLAALYQLRGRVGRGKVRAYAYLTTPPHQRLSETAQKRLNVMQSLDSLGAGFTLASHDLDIRGAGNLLGQEQSGHIKEIGVALYQKMLADAVKKLRYEKQSGAKEKVIDDDFSPQISIGLPVLIPDTYVADLDLRMELYRRIGDIETSEEIESLRAELVDRFGSYPVEVDNLLNTVSLKLLAKSAHIDRIDAGPKGANISFYQNIFQNPAGLVDYISKQMGTIRIKPDQKLLVMRPWDKPTDRLIGVQKIVQKIAEIAKSM